jgi:CheY-like chemotaxis protein
MSLALSVTAPEEQKIPGVAPLLQGKGCGGLPTVLLVDDEETVREVGKEFLQILGFRVSVAKDGEEALGLYRKQSSDFDVVLLDLSMPGMDGGEVYESLKKVNPQVKVLLVSGCSAYGKARKMLEKGCSGFLQKPFGFLQLADRIRTLCGYAEVGREVAP